MLDRLPALEIEEAVNDIGICCYHLAAPVFKTINLTIFMVGLYQKPKPDPQIMSMNILIFWPSGAP